MLGSIQIPLTILDTSWIIYSHRNGKTGEIWWLGKSRSADFLKFTDARRNRHWVETVLFSLDTVVVIEATAHGEIEASRVLYRLNQEYRPTCNKEWTPPAGKKFPQRTPVQCEQTLAIYASAAQAADSLGISRAAMSNHLNRRPGFATAKGFSFVRVIPGTPTQGIPQSGTLPPRQPPAPPASAQDGQDWPTSHSNPYPMPSTPTPPQQNWPEYPAPQAAQDWSNNE